MIVLVTFAITAVIAIVMLVAVILLMKSGLRDIETASAQKREFDKYDFEHRSSGGVVQFPTFEDAQRDTENRAKVHGTGFLGAWKMMGAIVLIIMIPLFVGVVVFLAAMGFFSGFERMFA